MVWPSQLLSMGVGHLDRPMPLLIQMCTTDVLCMHGTLIFTLIILVHLRLIVTPPFLFLFLFFVCFVCCFVVFFVLFSYFFFVCLFFVFFFACHFSPVKFSGGQPSGKNLLLWPPQYKLYLPTRLFISRT